MKRNEVTHVTGFEAQKWRTSQGSAERFDLKNEIKNFPAVLNAMKPLKSIKKETIIDQLPPKVANLQNEFYRCPVCNKNHWKGSHYQRMFSFIKRLRSEE